MSLGCSSLTGIVLAGGNSTRMGCDKASLPWNGSDMLNSVLYALAPACSRLIVVSNLPREIAIPEVTVVGDYYLSCGPLGGIHAGLSASSGDYNFVVACDMPYVNSQAVSFMAAAAAGYDAAVPFIDGHFHPLHAVYHRHCLGVITKMLEQGRYRIADFYPEVKLRLVSAAELSQFEPDCGMLRNLNKPEDLRL